MTSSVLFVCLGNICRSPLAEGAFRSHATRLGLEFEVDSAGTGDWHVGEPPDSRAVEVALRHGVDISHLRARQVGPEDFRRFDHVVAMDLDNLARLRRLAPSDGRALLSLLLDHVEGREGEPVADPYFGQAEHFEQTWADVLQGTEALAERIAAAVMADRPSTAKRG